VEFGMGETRAYYNTSDHDGHGITCRQSQRGVFMHNVILSPRGSGLAVWSGVEPYPTTDQVFAHNLVRDADPGLRLQIEQPNFADYNTYWPRAGKPLADGEKGRPWANLDELRAATGHEMHGEVRDAQPEDVGLSMVHFRVAQASQPDHLLGMVANAGAELSDPCGANLLPYFWRAAHADGFEPRVMYADYTGLPGGLDGFSRAGEGAVVALPDNPKAAHSGRRSLRVTAVKPAQMPSDGFGYQSPTLPTRPGDAIAVDFWLRGRDLEAKDGRPLTAFVEFSNPTGQHRQRVELLTEPLAGTFDWRKVKGAAVAPADATRWRLFLGLRPCTGSVWFDDVAMGAGG
jgi:hypothetical protein